MLFDESHKQKKGNKAIVVLIIKMRFICYQHETYANMS